MSACGVLAQLVRAMPIECVYDCSVLDFMQEARARIPLEGDVGHLAVPFCGVTHPLYAPRCESAHDFVLWLPCTLASAPMAPETRPLICTGIPRDDDIFEVQCIALDGALVPYCMSRELEERLGGIENAGSLVDVARVHADTAREWLMRGGVPLESCELAEKLVDAAARADSWARGNAVHPHIHGEECARKVWVRIADTPTVCEHPLSTIVPRGFNFQCAAAPRVPYAELRAAVAAHPLSGAGAYTALMFEGDVGCTGSVAWLPLLGGTAATTALREVWETASATPRETSMYIPREHAHDPVAAALVHGKRAAAERPYTFDCADAGEGDDGDGEWEECAGGFVAPPTAEPPAVPRRMRSVDRFSAGGGAGVPDESFDAMRERARLALARLI